MSYEKGSRMTPKVILSRMDLPSTKQVLGGGHKEFGSGHVASHFNEGLLFKI